MERDDKNLIALIGTAKLELVARGREHELYRARRADGTALALVKKTVGDPPTPRSVAVLHHEYELLHSLDLSGIVRVLGFAEAEDGEALVLEDEGFPTLKERLTARPLTVVEFLDVSVKLVEVLAQLHADMWCITTSVRPTCSGVSMVV